MLLLAAQTERTPAKRTGENKKTGDSGDKLKLAEAITKHRQQSAQNSGLAVIWGVGCGRADPTPIIQHAYRGSTVVKGSSDCLPC